MNIRLLSPATGAALLLALSTVLLGCAVSAQITEGGFPFATGGSSRDPGFVLDRLAGGDELEAGSGRIVTEQFDIRGFSKVDASHAFRVQIVHGSSYQVVVRVDDNLQRHLEVEKRGDTLVIGLKPYRSYNLRNTTLEAEVRLPVLQAVAASGASDLRISGFSSVEDFDVDLSGASYLDGEISAREVRIGVSGASRVRLQGEAEDLHLDASGASNLDLGGFPVEDADIELSGASEAEVVLTGTLDINASGASRLYFGGSPTVGRVDLSGASSIQRR
jgi:hypothetical protein